MRTPLIAAVTALVGFLLGWALRGGETRRERTIPIVSPAGPLARVERKLAPSFPDYPKPSLETPRAVAERPTPSVAVPPSIGGLSGLPPATGEIGPLAPLPTKAPPVADLNADEALARRVALGLGAEIVSSSDARDAGGMVGRTLVTEIAPKDVERLRSSLRAALGSRATLSDGGTVEGAGTEVRKAEDDLATLKKQLSRAQDDFLPNSPFLRNVEDAYRVGERNLAETRRVHARQRLVVLLRPIPGI